MPSIHLLQSPRQAEVLATGSWAVNNNEMSVTATGVDTSCN